MSGKDNLVEGKTLQNILYFSGTREVTFSFLIVIIDQGSSNLTLEGQSTAEFSSNPDQTHLSVIF